MTTSKRTRLHRRAEDDWSEIGEYVDAYLKVVEAVELFADTIRLTRDAAKNLVVLTVKFYGVAWGMRKN